MDDSFFDLKKLIGERIRVIVDRPVGYRHADIIYPVNYGYIPGLIAGDGEEQDGYILGISKPVSRFEGVVIAVIRRKNDNEDKVVVVPEGVILSEEEISKEVYFQERFFDSKIEM